MSSKSRCRTKIEQISYQKKSELGIDEAKRRRTKATALMKRDDMEIEKHDRLPRAGRENDLEMVSPTLVATVTRTIDDDVK
jgi:hypothetical protein